MSYSTYLVKKAGSIYKNFDRGTGVQFEIVFFTLKEFLVSILQIILICAFLFYIDWKMTLISLFLLPIMLFVGIYINKKTIERQNELNNLYDKVFGSIGDFFSNFLLAKTLHLESDFEKFEKKGLNEIYKEQYKVSKSWAIVNVYTTVIVNISRLLVIGFGSYFVIEGKMEFYVLFLFYAYINYVYFPLGFLFGSFQRIQKMFADAKKYYDEFENLDIENLSEGKQLDKIEGNICFENVVFGYSSHKHILNNLSFDIKKGKTVAFVGNT